MKSYKVSKTALAKAPADIVYSIIADYRNGHPHILPKQFTGLEVEKGGVGAGTVIRFQMKAMGRTTSARAVITEPEPGRVLVETGTDPYVVTTFTVQPKQNNQSEVTISTEMKSREGFAGAIERLFTSAYLKSVYKDELQLLGKLAEQRTSGR